MFMANQVKGCRTERREFACTAFPFPGPSARIVTFKCKPFSPHCFRFPLKRSKLPFLRPSPHPPATTLHPTMLAAARVAALRKPSVLLSRLSRQPQRACLATLSTTGTQHSHREGRELLLVELTESRSTMPTKHKKHQSL